MAMLREEIQAVPGLCLEEEVDREIVTGNLSIAERAVKRQN